MAIDDLERDQVVREKAVKQLRKRRDFYGHLLAYVLVNGMLVVIWAVTGVHGFFWPVFVMAPWGVGLVLNAWDVFIRRDITEAQITREMTRLGKSR
jgi:predicted tellurium resistance membrane protein TerC